MFELYYFKLCLILINLSFFSKNSFADLVVIATPKPTTFIIDTLNNPNPVMLHSYDWLVDPVITYDPILLKLVFNYWILFSFDISNYSSWSLQIKLMLPVEIFEVPTFLHCLYQCVAQFNSGLKHVVNETIQAGHIRRKTDVI